MRPVEPRPGGLPARPRTDAALRGFARFVLDILFREVALVGAEHLPATGPAIVIANHTNSLIDGAILLGYLPRNPRFLAASTVWDYKPVAPFMNASGSVKVFRQQDGRAHEGSLEDSFADAAALLADGGVLAVFPEGRTHDDPALLAFKTGTARIAQLAETRHGPLGLAIVPVGLDYEVKNRFRTRVCFTFGDPVTVAEAARAGPGPDPEEDPGADRRGVEGGPSHGVRALTARLRRAVGAVAPDFDDPRQARRLALAGEILGRSPGDRAGVAPPFDRIVTRRHAVEAALAGADAASADRLREALDAYARGLAELGLADPDVAAPPTRAALVQMALAALPGLPILAVALVFCLPQALLLGTVSRTKPRDRQMTWIAFGGLVVYPLSWLAWALGLGLATGNALGSGWGWAAALAVLVAAPLSARFSLPVLDRVLWLGRAFRAWRLSRGDPARMDALAAQRDRAVAALAALGPDRAG